MLEKLKVKVTRILFRSEENGFSVLLTKLIKSESEDSNIITEPVIVGNFYSVNKGDTLLVEGSWGYDNKNRYQFKTETYQTEIPATEEAIVEYLKRTVDGIGPKMAKKIVSYLGENTLEIIKSNPSKLTEIPGIGHKRATEIHETFTKNTDFEDLVMFLYPLGASHMDIVQIYDSIGNSAINQIRANPYSLFGLVKNLSFITLDRMAKNLGEKGDSKERISAGIDYYIKSSMVNHGHLFVFKDELLQKTEGFLKFIGQKIFTDPYTINKQDVLEVLNNKTESRRLVVTLNKEGKECVYLHFYYEVENAIVSDIKDMINNVNTNYIPEDKIQLFITKYQEDTGMKLAPNQENAVKMALTNKLSILSGGPGTGKTQTINTIIHAIKSIRPGAEIQLAAPTGRAAKRMTELTGMEAKTIHRLIGMNNLENEELTPIYSNYLILDEASMIDAHLFSVLLSQLSDDTSLLIVGDHQQLPSVGPGLILRDLMESGTVPQTVLNEIFRQAEDSTIILNAQGALSGNKEKITFKNNKDGDFYFIERKDVFSIRSIIVQSVKNMINNRGYKLSDIQVLTMIKKGPLGVESLNELLQKEFNKDPIKMTIGHREFRRNDRVMQTKNNYDLDVFNGDIGTITHIIEDGDSREIWVDYDGVEVVYEKESLLELTLSYAITIHKSQGSEYPVVIMPFDDSLSIMTNKNMINTGWTRASDVVVCVGDKSSLNKGILKEQSLRNSLIKEKLSV